MRSNLRFIALFLVATAAFAQRGGGFRGGFASGLGVGAGRIGGFVSQPGLPSINASRFHNGAFSANFPFGFPQLSNGRFFRNRLGFGRRFGSDFLFPFYPLYPFIGDYSYLPAAPSPLVDSYAAQPYETASVQPPAAPPAPAHPVMHEYKWPDESSAATGNEATFTIALRDGSQRSAVTAWVQDGSLHYVDAQDKTAVVSANLIDREATRRLNREKHLHIDLPRPVE